MRRWGRLLVAIAAAGPAFERANAQSSSAQLGVSYQWVSDAVAGVAIETLLGGRVGTGNELLLNGTWKPAIDNQCVSSGGGCPADGSVRSLALELRHVAASDTVPTRAFFGWRAGYAWTERDAGPLAGVSVGLGVPLSPGRRLEFSWTFDALFVEPSGDRALFDLRHGIRLVYAHGRGDTN